ncbi:MAG TPA: ABC transporter permease [Thermoplasmata archaeon]|nr:ABC transporter permease [Thermoplasmata archaeon]
MASVEAQFPNVPTEGRALPAFALVGWRWISRNPAVTITPVLLPFIFLYFLSLISPPSLLPLEIVGAMLFTMQNIGSWVLGDSATWRIECSLQDLFVASPLSRIRYLFGIAFSNLIAMLPALAILTVLLAWIGGERGHPLTPFAALALLASLFTLWILFSAVGMAISSRVRSQREIWPVGNLTFTMLGMLSPLYYPLSSLPPLWQDVARFLPTTYAALLAQGALGLTPATPAQLALYAGLLAVCAVVGVALCLRLYRWGEQ